VCECTSSPFRKNLKLGTALTPHFLINACIHLMREKGKLGTPECAIHTWDSTQISQPQAQSECAEYIIQHPRKHKHYYYFNIRNPLLGIDKSES
jgi:hypothetical protein